MIDLRQSRRTQYTLCKFWSVVNQNEYMDHSQISNKVAPSGYFYAREESPQSIQNQMIAGNFMLEQNEVTIFTTDNVYEPVRLKENDLVEFNGDIYRVTQVQFVPIKKQRQYLKEISHSAYISLRR